MNTDPIPYGYCQCGCGQKTTLATMTKQRLGHIKGQPIRYINGHQGRTPNLELPEPPNPGGLCRCGCGQPTSISNRNSYQQGNLKGHPIAFVHGHHVRINNPGKRKKANSDGTYNCARCNEPKQPTEFKSRDNASNGLESICKECDSSRYALWQKANPENCVRRDQKSRNLRRYGLTFDQYDSMLSQQEGLCAICRKPERRKNRTGLPHPLSIDHNHDTGVIRGLLCKSCNTAIGLLEDDPVIVQRAATYLVKD